MTPKEVVKIINRWAKGNNKRLLDYREMTSKDWGFAKRIGKLFNSELQLLGATYGVGNLKGFRYGFLNAYSYSMYKKVKKDLEDLSHESPDREIKKKD